MQGFWAQDRLKAPMNRSTPNTCFLLETHFVRLTGRLNTNCIFDQPFAVAVRLMSDSNYWKHACRTVLSSLCIVLSSATFTAADQVGVRVRFGVGDKEPAVWDGSVSVTDGKLLHIDGWRFQQMDALDGNSWKAQTRRAAARRTNNPRQANPNRNNAPVMDNGVLLAIDDAKPTTRISIKTKQGDFEFALSDVALSKSIPAGDVKSTNHNPIRK